MKLHEIFKECAEHGCCVTNEKNPRILISCEDCPFLEIDTQHYNKCTLCDCTNIELETAFEFMAAITEPCCWNCEKRTLCYHEADWGCVCNGFLELNDCEDWQLADNWLGLGNGGVE